jgi:hypothetical protein
MPTILLVSLSFLPVPKRSVSFLFRKKGYHRKIKFLLDQQLHFRQPYPAVQVKIKA